LTRLPFKYALGFPICVGELQLHTYLGTCITLLPPMRSIPPSSILWALNGLYR